MLKNSFRNSSIMNFLSRHGLFGVAQQQADVYQTHERMIFVLLHFYYVNKLFKVNVQIRLKVYFSIYFLRSNYYSIKPTLERNDMRVTSYCQNLCSDFENLIEVKLKWFKWDCQVLERRSIIFKPVWYWKFFQLLMKFVIFFLQFFRRIESWSEYLQLRFYDEAH